MHTVFLGLGSNLGNRAVLLRQALHAIRSKVGPIVRQSAVYETAPVGYKNQPDFLNMVVMVQTTLSLQEVFVVLQNIELALGRVRLAARKNRPRTIDIDILLYDRIVQRTRALSVPHPRLHVRQFVLEPFVEIAPRHVHPILQQTIACLWRNFNAL